MAGIDPWDVVDEAWASMAEKNFECKGPFKPFALRVAMNKARDAFRRAAAKREGRSLDAPLEADPGDEETTTLHDMIPGSEGAEVDYFRGLDVVSAAQKLALAEDAIFSALTDRERHVFLAVRVDGKSGAAVGRELVPPITGQGVGYIVAKALIRIQAYIRDREQSSGRGSDSEKAEGGEAADDRS
ncbi:MAG: hypothetical protein ACRDJJ_00840 [Actinomycetota bacterium]